ncbi:MAG: hypothetical protein KGL39_49170 [Patescibacteria group bacterium]|nr:hypothetical protein [Patescibacteria group bacterium]
MFVELQRAFFAYELNLKSVRPAPMCEFQAERFVDATGRPWIYVNAVGLN